MCVQVPLSLSALEAMLAPFPWQTYATGFYGAVTGMAPSRVLPSPLVLASGREYFQNLFGGVVGSTPVRVVADYLRLRALARSAPHLSAPFDEPSFAFRKAMTGVKAPPERWKVCVARTDDALPQMVGRSFVDAAFSPAARAAAIAMISGIKSAFEANLPDVVWMDEGTRDAAARKARLVYDMVGYPEWILNDTSLAEHYADFRMDYTSGATGGKSDGSSSGGGGGGGGGTYFAAHLEASKFAIRRNIRDLSRPVDKTRWSMSPSTVNAYYSPSSNKIVFPAGILQVFSLPSTFLVPP